MPESPRATVEMARCFNDRREALSLMHSAYVRAGLPSKSENALWVTRYQLLPRSRIFVAKTNGKVTSTLSLIPDSPVGLPLDGLPLDDLDRQQVDQLRARGLRIAEVSCFADRRQERGRSIGNFCSLLRFIAQYAHAQQMEALVMAGHPRRIGFLRNYLGFEAQLHGRSLAATDRPEAVLLWLEFERLRIQTPDKYDAYFGDSVSPKEFAGGFMPRWEADCLGRPCSLEEHHPINFPIGGSRLVSPSHPCAPRR